MCKTRLAGIPTAAAAAAAAASSATAQVAGQQQQQIRNCAPPLPSPSGDSATLPPPPAPPVWKSPAGAPTNPQSQNDQPAAAADAPDDDPASTTSTSSMGQCYPKCMPEVAGDVTALARAARSSRPRYSLAAMKRAAGDGGEDGDLEELAKMATLDLEELGGAVSLSAAQQPPKSIVVDYEDDTQLLQRRPRQNSVTDCARDACGPLGSAFAPQASGEIQPPTPGGRRRSRKDSIGNGSGGGGSSAAATPRRGKTTTLLPALDKLARDPASPSTETDSSEADERCSSVPKLCMCEVALHKSRASCWLVAGEQVYDATGILDAHPGGARSLLRKAGGPDCTQDMKFHTKNARKMLEKCFIGKLQPCGDEPERADSNCCVM